MASGKKNKNIDFICDVLTRYADTYNVLVAYLLIDSVMEVAYRNFPSFKKQVDDVPYNNNLVFQMADDLNKKSDNYSCPTNLNKLTYKKKYKNEKNTVYYALVHNSLK